MTAFLVLSFLVGIVIAVPVWIVFQRIGARRGLRVARRFNPEEAVPCLIEPVMVKGRLMPDLEDIEDTDAPAKKGVAR